MHYSLKQGFTETNNSTDVILIARISFLKHFVIKTIGIRKRRFDRSTVIVKQSEDKIYIGTNYIVEQRSDKCKKHENVKKRGIKNNKNIQE